MNNRSIFACALLLFAALLPAQVPPTGGVVVLGGENQQQTNSGVSGSNYVGALCAPADASFTVSFGNAGIKYGHRMWWWSYSTNPGFNPQTVSQTGTTAVVFGVASFVFTFGILPQAAQGWNYLFVDPTAAVIVSPSYTDHPTALGGFVMPSQGVDRFWIYWDVPNDPSLINAVVQMQTLRIDANSLWYLSNEHLTMIGQ